MNDILNNNLFLVKEHVGLLKAANNYDIYDPSSQRIILECREEHLGLFTRLLRFSDFKRMTPFDISIKTPDGKLVLRVKRGISILLSKVEVLDENLQTIGHFQQKLFSIGGAFSVMDAQNRPRCYLKGTWTGWNFKFLSGDRELAHVSKKWAGLGKELLTSADNYVLEISSAVPAGDTVRKLILAAVMCIDMVLKE